MNNKYSLLHFFEMRLHSCVIPENSMNMMNTPIHGFSKLNNFENI